MVLPVQMKVRITQATRISTPTVTLRFNLENLYTDFTNDTHHTGSLIAFFHTVGNGYECMYYVLFKKQAGVCIYQFLKTVSFFEGLQNL